MRRMRAMAALLLMLISSAAAARQPRAQGWLGLSFTYHERAEQRWLVVCGVASGGPAERGGLRVGDVITTIDGRRLASSELGVLEAFARLRAGDRVRVNVATGGQERLLILPAAAASNE